MKMMYTFRPDSGELTGSRPAQAVNGKEITRSAYATPTPPPDIPEGHAARWTGASWEVVEDHRQKLDSTGAPQGGTPYWLPGEGDDWQSPPRYLNELGPLPEGAVTTRPEKPAPTLEEARASALAELADAFAAAEAPGKTMSSAGFVIDATERSNRDIEGLITSLEATSTPETTFCAADNSFHTVTLDQLRTMRLEVIRHGQALYARKWELRTAIEAAQSVEAVQAVDINFDGVGA